MIFLLCLLTLGAQGQNLTVNFTFTDNSTYTVNTAPALADAFAELATASKTVADVKELEVTAGTVVAQFWEDLRGEKSNLTALTKLTITDGVDAVANIPYSSNSNGMLFSTSLQEINIAKVQKLDNHSFNGLSNLMKLDCPNATYVGVQAFRGTALKSLSLPKAEYLGDRAFFGCTNLTTVDFPEVTFVDSVCFSGCSKLDVVKLPKAIRLRGAAFNNCTSLTEIELPSAEITGENVFNGCSKLTTVKLPKATSLGYRTLYGLQALKHVELNSLTKSREDKKAIIEQCHAIEHLDFPELKEAYHSFIRQCSGLQSVSIPKIEKITNQPFYNCTTLTVIKMGETPPSIYPANYIEGFAHQPNLRNLIICNPDGIPLIVGAEYNTAKADYLAMNDGDNTDNLWYGWSIADAPMAVYTIAASANPIAGGSVTGARTYSHGESVTLTATANEGYHFVKWTENGNQVSTDEAYTFTADQPHTLVAEFELNTYTIAASANPTAGGSVAGANTYTHGESVTLTAVANTGYTFVNWTEGGIEISADETYTFIASQARTFVANFEVSTYNITAMAYPTEGGMVTGDGSYKHGETVSLTASPNSGYTFAGWYNGLTFLDNNSPYSFAATEAANIIAKFDTIKVTNITLDITGTLLRKVGDTPVQITATIEPADALDKTITWTSSNELVATVADGLVQFVGVGYTTITATAASGVSASCIVNVFPAKYSITVDPNITNGEIMNFPSEAAAGDQVDLFVTPESGYQLVAGSLKVNGDASIVEPNGINQYKFSMPAEDVVVTAHFELIPTTTYAISIATDIENGTVVANPTMAAEGTPVTLTVTPAPNYQLVAGSLKYNGIDVTETAGTYTFIMPGEDVLITAQFELSTIVVPSVESVALNSTAVTLEVAETHLLQATVLPAEANQGVTWTSNNEAVATVVDGEITAVAMGTSIITATTDDGNLTAYCVVNVNNNTLPDAIASFEDLTLAKADTFWTGASNPDGLFTSFVSGTYRFVNTSGWGGTYWAGFAYTNTTATDAANWNTTNVGTGIDGSQNYGVAYYSSWDFPTGITVERTNTTDAKPISGMYVTNTAQVVASLTNGDAFAKKFEQGDWFKLTATADNGNSVDFYLADFRSSDATEHYIVDSWEWLDLSPLGDVKTVSFTMSSSDVGAYGVNTPTYFAFDDFGGVAPNFNLTYTAGANGSLTGELSQTVAYGQSGAEVLAVADGGYQFLRWSDGRIDNPRTDTNVQADLSVVAEFIDANISIYTLTYTAAEGGSIRGVATQSVVDGQSGTEVEAVANEGYRFVQWSDGVSTAKRLDENITADLSVQAEFEELAPIVTPTYYAVTLSVSDAAAGAVSGAADYEENTEASVEATANKGYRFVRWNNGETANPYTFTVTGDVALVAEFIKQVRIDYIAAANGSINGAGSQTIDLGSTTTEVEAKPADGYRFVKWSDGHTEASRTDVATTDTTFVASFELIRYILTISVMDADAKLIAFAKVTIGDKEYKANEQGMVVDTLVPDRYSYKVECEGYDSKSGEVVLNKNIEEKVVLNKSTNTGLFNNTIESLTVYPNPTVGAVQLEANGMVRVYNASGNLVERVQANGMVLIDLSNYPAGVYIIKVGKASAKVIKN